MPNTVTPPSAQYSYTTQCSSNTVPSCTCLGIVSSHFLPHTSCPTLPAPHFLPHTSCLTLPAPVPAESRWSVYQLTVLNIPSNKSRHKCMYVTVLDSDSPRVFLRYVYAHAHTHTHVPAHTIHAHTCTHTHNTCTHAHTTHAHTTHAHTYAHAHIVQVEVAERRLGQLLKVVEDVPLMTDTPTSSSSSYMHMVMAGSSMFSRTEFQFVCCLYIRKVECGLFIAWKI